MSAAGLLFESAPEVFPRAFRQIRKITTPNPASSTIAIVIMVDFTSNRALLPPLDRRSAPPRCSLHVAIPDVHRAPVRSLSRPAWRHKVLSPGLNLAWR